MSDPAEHAPSDRPKDRPFDSDAGWKSLIENISSYIVVVDRDGAIQYVNQALPGTNVEDVIGTNAFEYVHQDHRNLVREVIDNVFRTRAPRRYESRAAAPGQNMAWYSVQAVPIKDDDAVIAVSLIATDISEQKRAKQALTKSLQASADIVRSIPSGLFIYRHDESRGLVLLDANPEAERLTGVSLDRWRGHDFDEIWPDARRRGITKAFADVAKTGEVLRTEDLYYKDDRLEGAYRVCAFPMPENRVGVAFEDITKLKQAEEERERLMADLEAKNAELERFAYTVSHDLKSPLITIKGFAGLLKEDIGRSNLEAAEADVGRIEVAADRMARLLNELLELSRIGRQVNPPQHVPLEDLVREALDLVGGRVAETGAEVEIAEDLPVLDRDRHRLLEVMQNLIDNAVKYSGDLPQPRVEIGSRTDNGECVIYVRDNGIGINPDYQTRVFGLFDQLDPSTEGTGIGLALAERIIQIHGGRIGVESDGDGCGSTFCFTIPPGDDDEPES